jgi:hypothetical protein
MKPMRYSEVVFGAGRQRRHLRRMEQIKKAAEKKQAAAKADRAKVENKNLNQENPDGQ